MYRWSKTQKIKEILFLKFPSSFLPPSFIKVPNMFQSDGNVVAKKDSGRRFRLLHQNKKP